MSNRSIIPFGPQHPVLPEPIHLDLVLEDEKVVEAIPTIGFVHRGLEKLVEKKDFQDYVFVAERICGICSFMHGMGYSQAVEKLMDIKIPERAEYLRVIWAELSRIHSHILWLGLLADAFGFESLFMQCFRIREKILNIFEMTTGGRIIFSVCKVGGVKKDINLEKQKIIVTILRELRKELKEIESTFFDDVSVKKRLVGVGILSKEDAYELGCVGPMARASGIDYDARKLGYSVYKNIDFKIITDDSGDSYSRCIVRFKEIFESINIIIQAIDIMPEGEISVKV